MALYHVERQSWQRWPRVLVCVKDDHDGTVERRRYVPEGGTVEEWKARLRDALGRENEAWKDYAQAMVTLQGETAKAAHLQAEVDGLKTMLEDRDELICDMYDDFHRIFEGGRKLEYEKRIAELGFEVER